eukprot:CAMPEP_0171983190 /NCGR_PEP_ID=MMETSP0993-20121228/273160_1 /TAXON_ID=483369 /ORGANISM="non described non described, Strain CCMP2098" /LENGTH=151 /DNA_ID=CAMNT_0012635935 /DNA_START=984 /DNA_END=1439 /DNA_ORIENTATION=+
MASPRNGKPQKWYAPEMASPRNGKPQKRQAPETASPRNGKPQNQVSRKHSSSTLGQSALPSEAAEIAPAALAIVKPNHAPMVYGTLTPTTREEAITGQQQPEDSMGRTTTTEDHTIEPALEVAEKKGRARGHNRKQLPGNQRKHAKTTNTH